VGLFAILAVGLGLAAGSDGKGFLDTVFSATDVSTRKDSVAAQASPLPPWSALQPLVARTALIMGAGAGALALIAWRRAGRWTGAVVAATMLAVMPIATRALDQVAGARAVSGMAAEVRLLRRRSLLAHGRNRNSGRSVSPGRRPCSWTRRSVLGIGATFRMPRTFWTAESRRSWLSGARSCW
jgi:hypothetical protein